MTGVLLFFLLSFLSTDDTLSRDECHVARDDYRVIDVSSWIGQDRPWNVRKSFDENRGGLFSSPFPRFHPSFASTDDQKSRYDVYRVFIAPSKRESSSIDTRTSTSRNRIDFVRMKQKNKKKNKKKKKKIIKKKDAHDTSGYTRRVHGLMEGAENVKIEIDGTGVVCCRNLRREHEPPPFIFIQYNQPSATILDSCTNDLSNPPARENDVRVKTSK